jgi:hypothetical protein
LYKRLFSLFSFSFLFSFLLYWGLNSGPYLELLYQPFFVMGFFKIGSLGLFSLAGFEPRSSYLCLLSG